VSGKTTIQNWRWTIQLLLESDDEQNSKYDAQNHIFIHNVFNVETKNIEIILVVVYIMSECMVIIKKWVME